jgi:formylglycine-generating enzyme required for sulfatase activity
MVSLYLFYSCLSGRAFICTVCVPNIYTPPDLDRDNEYGNRSYEVPAFQAAKYKTTNGEFWEFVCDGGYGKSDLWTDAGIHTIDTALECSIFPFAITLTLADLA